METLGFWGVHVECLHRGLSWGACVRPRCAEAVAVVSSPLPKRLCREKPRALILSG